MGQTQSNSVKNCMIQLNQYRKTIDAKFPKTEEVAKIQKWIECTIIICNMHLDGKFNAMLVIQDNLTQINQLLQQYVK
jgi:hypothetical protein